LEPAGTLADIEPILEIERLSLRFPHAYGDTTVLDAVTVDVGARECFGLVGESGSGKSLLALAICGLLPQNARLEGSIKYRGEDLLAMPAKRRAALRGSEIAMVYQDALSSLNPGLTIGRQLSLVCRLGSRYSPADLLELVSLSSSQRILQRYPHELSGGQRQRVLIALALARDPRVIVADEPTTALDVTVQDRIVELLRRLHAEIGFALILISHDLALVASMADRIGVIYAGQLIEVAEPDVLLNRARHQYTNGLIAASRSLERVGAELVPIGGVVPGPRDFATGCRFRDRCGAAQADCQQRPALVEVEGTRFACHHPVERRLLELPHAG
jgi:oligopeptide/dipeptide ABC transporter ATP-binding protein